MSTTWRREWTEIAAIAAVSFVLYQLNVFVLFLIPVQIVYARRGGRAVLLTAALVIAAIALTAAFRLRGVQDASLRRVLIVIEFALPFFLVGGVAAVDVAWSWWPGETRPRRLVKLGLVTGAAGLLSIPIVIAVSRNDGLNSFFLGQIEAFRSAMNMSSESDPTASYALSDMFSDPQRLADLASRVMLQTYLFSYFSLLGASIWFGDYAASKTLGTEHRRLFDFRAPEHTVWLFLFGWALVLLDLAVDIGALRYVGWNVGMVTLLIYGLQGASIIRHWLIRRGASTVVRVCIGIAVVMLMFWPGANLLVIIGIPGLGVSETWIQYRKSVKE